jgi:hypothetical protein
LILTSLDLIGLATKVECLQLKIAARRRTSPSAALVGVRLSQFRDRPKISRRNVIIRTLPPPPPAGDEQCRAATEIFSFHSFSVRINLKFCLLHLGLCVESFVVCVWIQLRTLDKYSPARDRFSHSVSNDLFLALDLIEFLHFL